MAAITLEAYTPQVTTVASANTTRLVTAPSNVRYLRVYSASAWHLVRGSVTDDAALGVAYESYPSGSTVVYLGRGECGLGASTNGQTLTVTGLP